MNLHNSVWKLRLIRQMWKQTSSGEQEFLVLASLANKRAEPKLAQHVP